MTEKQIKYSIDERELKLGFWGKLTHFGIIIFLLLMPASLIFFHVIDYIAGDPKPFREDEQYLILIPSILGLLFYLLQKKRLKFKIIETELTRTQLDRIIEKVENELDWSPYIENEAIYLAKTPPSFLYISFGERVTILFDKNKVLINSICDPDSRWGSVISMGRNKRNMSRLIEEIKKANH